jgi:apolipoprotein N-acyltransferase
MVAMVKVSIGAAVVTAILLWAASPAVGAGPLAWVALLPVATVVLSAPGTRAARLAVPLAYAVYLELLLVPALPFGIASGQWGDAAVPVMVGDSPVLLVAFVAVPLFGALLYLIRFGEPWGAELLGPRLSMAAAVLVPAVAWTGLDLLRAMLEPGGSWGPLFLSQLDPPASDLASLGGPWLVTLAIVAVNYGLALTVVRRRPAPALVPALAIAALLMISAVASDEPSGPPIAVAAVQPGYDTSEEETEPRLLRHWYSGEFNLAARDLFRDLGGLTRRAARDGAEIVVWPEAVTFVDLEDRRGARGALRRIASDSGVTIVAPYFDHASQSSAAIAASPRGALTSPRPKQRPMWFLGERAAGTEPRTLPAARRDLGTLLGVDVQDPNLPRALSHAGAEIVTSSTHDWPQLATQHRALAALGAKASGVPIVRADWRYGSAIYDRHGEVVADAGQGRTRTVLVAEVRAGSPTPYARLGDAIGWIALAAAAIAWLAAAAARVTTRGDARAFGGRAPRRESPRPRPSPVPPRADGVRSPPPP